MFFEFSEARCLRTSQMKMRESNIISMKMVLSTLGNTTWTLGQKTNDAWVQTLAHWECLAQAVKFLFKRLKAAKPMWNKRSRQVTWAWVRHWTTTLCKFTSCPVILDKINACKTVWKLLELHPSPRPHIHPSVDHDHFGAHKKTRNAHGST